MVVFNSVTIVTPFYFFTLFLGPQTHITWTGPTLQKPAVGGALGWGRAAGTPLLPAVPWELLPCTESARMPVCWLAGLCQAQH